MSRTVTLCMAPSVELWQPEAKHMGHVAEQMIARDYLNDTQRVPLQPHEKIRNTVGNFFDLGTVEDYKTALTHRHPLEVDRNVLKSRHIRVPDVSTWQGEFRERTLGISLSMKEGHRNEHYEVKPHNEPNEKKGQEKLDDITLDNRALLLSARLIPPYKRGEWYPQEARQHPPKPRRIAFTAQVVYLRRLLHKLRRWSKIMRSVGVGASVNDFWLEVTRKQPGLLLYRVCVELEVDDDCTEEFENALAAKVVRVVYEYLTLQLSAEARKAEEMFLRALRPVFRSKPGIRKPGPDPKVPLIGKVFEREARYEVSIVRNQLVQELASWFEQLRASLVSRGRGLPGEAFIVACDDTFYQQEVLEVRTRAMARNIGTLKTMYGPSTPGIASGLTLSRSASLTYDQAVRAMREEAKKFTADPMKWLEEHKKEIITAVVIVVVVTALVIACLMTAGAALAAVPAAEGALVTGAVATEATMATGLATGGGAAILTTEGALASAGTAAVAGESSLAVGVNAGLTAEQLTLLRLHVGMMESAEAAGALGRLAPEAVIDEVMLSQGAGAGASGAAAGATLNTMMVPGLFGFFGMLDAQTKQKLRDELVSGGAAVAGFSTRLLNAAGFGENPQPSSMFLGLGRLYLLNAKLPAVDQLPALEQEFDCAAHTDDFVRLKGSGDAPKRLRYLGLLQVR